MLACYICCLVILNLNIPLISIHNHFLFVILHFWLQFGNEMPLSNHVTRKTWCQICKLAYIHKILLKMVKRLKLVGKADFLLTFLYVLILQTIYIYMYVYMYIYIVNIIHKQQSNLYQNDKEIKPSCKVLRVSCKHVFLCKHTME